MVALMETKVVNKTTNQRREAKLPINFLIGLVIAVVILVQVVIPIIKDQTATGNLSTSEKALLGLITFVLIAALVVGVTRFL